MLRKYAAHNGLWPFYLAWQVNPQGFHYNMNFSYQLSKVEGIDLLIENLQKLIQARPYLRQTFMLENGQLMACIHDHLPAEINFLTTSARDSFKLEQLLLKEPHDISSKSSVRLNIIRFTDSHACMILFNIHHILMDGLSLSHFLMELNQLIAGEQIELENADDYILKISHQRSLQEVDEDLKLNEYIQEINTVSAELNYPTGNKELVLFFTDILPNEIIKKLTDWSRQNRISIYNLMLLAWGIFTAKIFDRQYALINYPVNIRSDMAISGCFVNVIKLALRLNANDTYLSLTNTLNNKIANFRQVSLLKIEGQLSEQTIPSFSYSNLAQPDDLNFQGTSYISKTYPQIANSNIGIKYREKSGKFYFCCEILSGIFPDYLAASLLKRFFNFLNNLLTNPLTKLADIDLTLVEEKQKILHEFNNTDAFYPESKTLIELFDEIVGKYPNKIAVKAFNGEISYDELNDRAEQLASFLIEEGIKPENIVGILIDNRLEMIIAIMAVLKSGAAYLPITHTMPVDNISDILKDSEIKLLLTIPHFFEKININITKIDINKQTSPSLKYTKPEIKPNNLAYMIKTSGTTGKPKGVLVEHKAIVNIIWYYMKQFSITSITNCSKYAEFGFDASVIEIFPALLSGATLHIIPDQERKNIYCIKNFFNNFKINFGFLPTQLAELFLEFDNDYLKNLIVAGEKLNKYKPVNFNVVNSYGATETAVHVTAFTVDKKYNNIPIGKPISNVKCYVVNTDVNLLPIGQVGELLVGGESLARGYLSRPQLTAEKFIDNPFQTNEEKINRKNLRLYKTGDLVRWLPNGNLEYVGRNDSQIKIRGYRIELGEIENKLNHYPEIDKAVVLVKNHFYDKYLVAYYNAKNKLDEEKLRNYLSINLPEYMQPSNIVYVDKFPLTVNGKVDKNSLPEINFYFSNNYTAPTNSHEQLVCDEFSKVLQLEKVGIDDDFFRLGGNSIKAIALMSSLQYNFNVTISDIYHLRTPRKISKNFSFEKNNLIKRIEKVKLLYKERKDQNEMNPPSQENWNKYQESIYNLKVNHNKKQLNNVLLTGATGFLGCNLLNEILFSTSYNVFLLVRSESDAAAFSRVNKKFQFYFQKTLDSVYNKRLFVLASDIEQEYLGLSDTNYHILTTKIDSIIHSAAITKRFGEADIFYSANVQATIYLLEFCKLTQLKDFHYISTTSVLHENYNPNAGQSFFTEDDRLESVKDQLSLYVKTKCLAEREVINYRQQGVVSNIYRVGNLAFMARNLHIQENSEENGFLSWIKCILNLKMIAKEVSLEEISPADLTAEAIIKLFDKQQTNNYIYHLFNPNLYNLSEFFSQNSFWNVEIVSIDQFIDTIIERIKDPFQQALIERFLARQGWLNDYYTPAEWVKILQSRTHTILHLLNFTWRPIDDSLFNRYLKIGTENAEKSKGVAILANDSATIANAHLLGG